MPRLEDKVVIITGASAGIGAVTARRFAAAGARVVLNARRADRIEALAEETGGVAVAGDVSDPDVQERILAACPGRVDVLVNNAGYAEPGPVEAVPDAEAKRQFDVNVFAAAGMMRAVLPLMRAARSGRIVNISSVAGRFGYPLFGWYCATKHALEGLSDAARFELAPFDVQVVLVEPGPIETEFFDVTMERAQPRIDDRESPYRPFFDEAESIEKDMMKRAGTADDVARVIEKACTARRPKARYAVTGMAKSLLLMLKLLPRSWVDAGVRRQFRIPARID